MTDEAVRHRVTKCVSWLERLLSASLSEITGRTAVERWRVKIVDGTVLCCPGAVGTDYRMHLCFEAIGQRGCAVRLSDAREAERFTHFEFAAGELVLGDRVYATAKQIAAVKQQVAEVMVRFSFQQLRVFDAGGLPLEWKEALREAQTSGSLSLEAYLKDESGQFLKVYLHTHRLSPEQIQSARRRIRRQASKKGHPPRAETLLLCEWVTVLTTISETELSSQAVLQLYRVRWQIELFIKRLKSILRLGKIRARVGSPLAQVHLLGKMLCAVILEKVAAKRLGVGWTQMTGERQATWFRVWKLMREELVEDHYWDGSVARLALAIDAQGLVGEATKTPITAVATRSRAMAQRED